jgi:hypothetical protein
MTFNKGYPQESGSLDSLPIRQNFEHLFDTFNTHASGSNPHNLTLDNVCDQGAVTDQNVTVGNDLYVGNSSSGSNKNIYANNGDVNLPALRYNESTNHWEYSDDGVNFHTMSGSVGGGSDTLDDVCDRGNSTDQSIYLGAQLILNKDYGDNDAIINFRYSGANNETLKWDKTDLRFEFSEKLWVDGNIILTGDVDAIGNVDADGNISINKDNSDADAILYFYRPTSDFETLRWDKTDVRFEFSKALLVGGDFSAYGNFYINCDYGDQDAILYFKKPVSGVEFLKWNKDSGWFEFSEDLLVSGSLYIGNGTSASNKNIFAYNGDTNLPALRYNETANRWEYSDDGVIFNSISGSGGGNHNTLAGLQGGQADEYYHLKSAEHSALVDGGSADGYHTHPSSGSGGGGSVTKYILLPIEAATLPDDSTGNKAAAIERKKSSAGAPSPHFMQALFDADTEEFLYWSFRIPGDYSSGLTAKIQYKMASATSGKVDFDVALMAVSDGDSQDVDADSMSTVNSGDETVPGTAGYLGEISITLTNVDNLAAGDFVVIYLKRDADDGTNDTATGDCEVIAFSLEYTPS